MRRRVPATLKIVISTDYREPALLFVADRLGYSRDKGILMELRVTVSRVIAIDEVINGNAGLATTVKFAFVMKSLSHPEPLALSLISRPDVSRCRPEHDSAWEEKEHDMTINGERETASLPAKSPYCEDPQENTRKKKTILIVDDTLLMAVMVSTIIKNLGHNILIATSGREALSHLTRQGNGIEVVISDVIMPEISGVDLLAIIHELHPSLPVILMTAYSDVDIMISAIKKGAFDIILKPLDAGQIKQALDKALKHNYLLKLEKNYLSTLKLTVAEKTKELNKKITEQTENKAALVAEHEKQRILFSKVNSIKLEWEQTMDCIGDMVLLTDHDGKIRRCNQSLRVFTGTTYLEIIGRDWRELFSSYALKSASSFANGSELQHSPSDRWFLFTVYPFTREAKSELTGTVLTLHDTTKLKTTMDALAKAYVDLKMTQAQVIQNEKMASIGLLAAGVAHEINNPIGFVSSNLNTLGKYLRLLTEYINLQDKIIKGLDRPDILAELEALRLSLKVNHILGDVGCLISQSLDGTSHVCKIVNDLNVFSRKDDSTPRLVNLAEILDSTITLIWNEIKYKAALQKNYGTVPSILGNSQQLNQVFMNLLINAGHAIESEGKITVTTWAENGNAFVSIGDTGHGIAQENLNRIFEPFFTTKEVGKGTGLGLSISYDIINKHSGEIIVESVIGQGTTFTVKLPLAKEQ